MTMWVDEGGRGSESRFTDDRIFKLSYKQLFIFCMFDSRRLQDETKDNVVRGKMMIKI